MAGRQGLLYLAGAVVALGLIAGGPASAEECEPLTPLASLHTVPAPDGFAMLVPTKVDGVRQMMLVDTGGVYSEISERTAKALKLMRWRAPTAQYGVLGQSTDVVARAHSFTLGDLHAKSIDFMVSKDPAGSNNSFNGVIAPSLLRHFDVELDFAQHRMTLLSPNHCAGQVVYWPATTISVLPFHATPSGHIVVPVELDGVRMNALIDTGMTYSTLSLKSAERRFGLMPGDAQTPHVGNLPGSPHAKIYGHSFKTLRLGDIVVRRPEVAIIPDLVGAQIEGDKRQVTDDDPVAVDKRLPSLLIGMDVLHDLHLYIAYKEGKLYLTPANMVSASR